ncbi:hypothetical protein GSI_14229 [Ganoderma sinense ZZ0214-1]|uniref:Uncharacterized protein n=1 Tax=Ganoderma sinense ZZ0214-1 TaxID=1077348 RepID=A0A2G8RSI5_9APHY|nr:hypothetical protein GSI_14229 [Ganoderma sinense ZZ0214-1]
MAFMNHAWLVGQMPLLNMQPVGIYGISYDIYTRPTEDPVPQGWQSHRSYTYRQLIDLLRADGFVHHQYSDYRHPNITAWEAYNAMVNLVYMEPFSKLATTVKGMKLHYISDLNLLDATNEVRVSTSPMPLSPFRKGIRGFHRFTPRPPLPP